MEKNVASPSISPPYEFIQHFFQHQHNLIPETHNTMDIHVKGFDGTECVIEVVLGDTVVSLIHKVSLALTLAEDSFNMHFRDTMLEDEDIIHMSADDTVTLTQTDKYFAIARLHALGVTDLTAEALETVTNPEVACLLLQAEVAVVVPHKFLSATSLVRVDFSGALAVSEIGNDFLSCCEVLEVADLSGMERVTGIGSYFLACCPSLVEVYLSGFGRVTEIGNSFLWACCSLTLLDLSALRAVTTLGVSFVSNCDSVTDLNLSMPSVVHIGFDFVNCNSLERVDLTGCSDAVLQRSPWLKAPLIVSPPRRLSQR